MRESRTYGSVRGALSNERPYRDDSLRCTNKNPGVGGRGFIVLQDWSASLIKTAHLRRADLKL
jgi:hypothetical protein